MTKAVSMKNWSKDMKISLLKELGYESDGTFVLDKMNKKVIDCYTNEAVRMDNMAIFNFGGVITIIDNNPLSIFSFFEETRHHKSKRIKSKAEEKKMRGGSL